MDLKELRGALRREGVLTLSLRVAPRSPKTAWAGALEDGRLKLRLNAIPEKGKANEELIRFLASEFGVARDKVEIFSGVTSQNKQVRIAL